MRVGDLVKIVQSEKDRLMSPFVDQVGVIVKKSFETASWQDDWYDVLTRDNIRSFRIDYLEEIK
jgi:hypothetical protein|tara:strand:+ start:275 stop:466 length:192 start_codon:yes stop_codon:yes gene_type:complete